MRSIRRSNIDLPVHAINANIIFARGRASAVFRVPTKSFEFLSLAEKHALHGQLAWWMIKVEADFSIYRVCREYPVDEYERDASGLLDERFADRGAWEQLVRSHTEHMRSMRSFTPEVYFVVSLQPPRRAPWSRVSRDLSVLRDAEQSVFDMLHEHLSDARRASTLELQWLMRRAGVRGVCEPDTDPNWSPPAMTLDGGVWEAGRADVQSFMSAVTENRRTVLAEGEDGESLQAMLMLGKPPKQAEYPGAAELLFAPLESLDFPVDAVLHARWIPNKKMLSIADNSIKDAHDEVLDASARFLDQKTRRRALEVDSVQDYFASEPYPPGLETFISLAVGVPTSQPDLLKQRVKRLRRAYGSVKLYQPYALQSDLYGDHLLRPDGSSPSEYRRDYKRLLIVEQVSAMMPIGANQGGSDSGIYFGHTIPGTRRPVKHDLLEAFRLNRTGAILLNGSLGSGKALHVDTPIPTTVGWTTMGDISVGDEIFDETGSPCNVVGVYDQPSGRDCYEVLFSDGEKIIADADHLWATRDLSARRADQRQARRGRSKPSHPNKRHGADGRWVSSNVALVEAVDRAALRVRTTTEIRDTLSNGNQLNHAVPVAAPLQTPDVALPLPPYTLGIWLAEGDKSNGGVTLSLDDVEAIERQIQAENVVSWRVPSGVGSGCLRVRLDGWTTALGSLGLLSNKHIPDSYMRASESQRRALLAGLLDGDGTVAPRGATQYDSMDERLAESVLELARSLGYRATLISKQARLNGRDYGLVYRVTFTTTDRVFRAPRKLLTLGERTRSHNHRLTSYRYIKAVTPVESVPVRCIEVDSPSHLFLAGKGMIPTHNTIAVQLLAYLAARRGSLVVDIDPKKPVPDHSLERWPGLEDRTHEILISNSDNHRGQLDPLIVALPDMREELATSYMMDILPQATPEWQTEIIDSVRAVLRDSRPSSMRVVERLLASDDSHARAAGKALRVWSDWGLAKCAFSHGEQYDLDAHMPVTMIKAPALTLPLAGTARASYDQSERVSVATFKLIIARALRLLSGRDRTVHKFLVIDEAHVLTTTADGRRFLEMVIRMGRYMNITVVLASQLAGDLAELEQLIGIRFAFRQETDEQASINLRMNGLDGDDRQLIKMLRGFSDGRCLMRGLDGRVIPMRFDVVDPEILRIADTNPTRALAALEDAFVA